MPIHSVHGTYRARKYNSDYLSRFMKIQEAASIMMVHPLEIVNVCIHFKHKML